MLHTIIYNLPQSNYNYDVQFVGSRQDAGKVWDLLASLGYRMVTLRP